MKNYPVEFIKKSLRKKERKWKENYKKKSLNWIKKKKLRKLEKCLKDDLLSLGIKCQWKFY